MEIEVTKSEQEFLQGFLTDAHRVGIPLTAYAWKYIHAMRLTNTPPGELFDFIRQKALESGENFSLKFAADPESPMIYGPVLCHRLFSEWLITQDFKMKTTPEEMIKQIRAALEYYHEENDKCYEVYEQRDNAERALCRIGEILGDHE